MARPIKPDRPVIPACPGMLLPILLFLISAIAPGCTTAKQYRPADGHAQAASPAHLSEARRIVVNRAVESIGADYTWGGSSPSTGFDCSGLVVYTHQAAGVATPRTARDMFSTGRSVTASIRPGDLVFFNSPGKKTSVHVGIFIGRTAFIHAPGRGKQVTRASLSNPYFSRYFIGARTFL